MAPAACRVEKIHEPGLHVVVTHRDAQDEWFILAYPLPGEAPELLFERAARVIRERGAVILNHFVWHKAELRERARATWEAVLGKTAWPVSWMACSNGQAPFGGTTIRAVSGADVRMLRLRDRVVGACYESATASYLLLGDLRDDNLAHSPTRQTEQVFEDMLAGLGMVGMDFSRVMRTWFFNDDILAWYTEFNRVRTDFFKQHGVFDRVVPASTGIGARNADGGALIASLIAARTKDGTAAFYAVPSPLQQPALDYGSSFSRALELSTPDRRHLFVSGTASIDPHGVSAHVEDVKAQTELTLDVIEAILKSRDMEWSDALEGVGYIRRSADCGVILRCLQERGLKDLPILLSNNTVCRDDLLFELELQAATERTAQAYPV